jgi:hypothetical protein
LLQLVLLATVARPFFVAASPAHSFIGMGMGTLFHFVDLCTALRGVGRAWICLLGSAPRRRRIATDAAKSGPAHTFAFRAAGSPVLRALHKLRMRKTLLHTKQRPQLSACALLEPFFKRSLRARREEANRALVPARALGSKVLSDNLNKCLPSPRAGAHGVKVLICNVPKRISRGETMRRREFIALAGASLALSVMSLSTVAYGQNHQELSAIVTGPWHHVPDARSTLEFNREMAKCQVVSAQTPVDSTTPPVVEIVHWRVLIV